MTLSDKANFLALQKGHGVENFNVALRTLCLPSFTLSDGPNGLAGRVSNVTQLPAAIDVAASFDPSVAYAAGRLVAQEARTKGIDVVQGPDLNLARVALGGRVFESYGEDPLLTSAMGVASIDGIQSEGVMAMAKHFVAYTQETARARLNQLVTPRALAELYEQPFEAAVKDAHVAAIMCATGSLNGSAVCSDPSTYQTLASWGFKGFVRSDERAARNPTLAFASGLDLIKPATARTLERLVRGGTLPVRYLNRAARTVLTSMFAYGLVARPRRTTVNAVAATPSHTQVALQTAEAGTVLLKDENQVLPLSTAVRSVAVIGTDARYPVSSGSGSSQVIAPFTVSPLRAVKSTLGGRVRVLYAPGGPGAVRVAALKGFAFGHRASFAVHTPQSNQRSPNADLFLEAAANVTDAVITASAPGHGRGWSHWRDTFRATKSGTYEIALQQIGDTWLALNGRTIIASPGLHAPSLVTAAVQLRRGRTYTLAARWFSVIRQGPPELGMVDVTHQIALAAALARRSKVAVVFAGEPSTEGADQSSFNLPGDDNALIAAVAAANPHTIVVLNTGNPVLMPWLNRVQGVLEAWYPGEEDGKAIAAILSGAYDPSGRLPVTFPASATAQPTSTPASFPGVDDEVNFGSGAAALDLGYRWYQSHRVTALFPFGFGLDYTSFQLSSARAHVGPTSITVHVVVTNTGQRAGADVVQVYVADPAGAGEPPEQLRAFARVDLAPSASRNVVLNVPRSSLQVFQQGTFVTVPGTYGVNVGESSTDLPVHLDVSLS